MKIYGFRLFWGHLFLSLQEEVKHRMETEYGNFYFLSTLLVERHKYHEIYGTFVLQSERIKKSFWGSFLSLNFYLFCFSVFTSSKWTRFRIVMLRSESHKVSFVYFMVSFMFTIQESWYHIIVNPSADLSADP